MANDRRLTLQNELEELLGSKNVYYQPPENIKMNYPAIMYSKSNMNNRHANDKVYKSMTRYDITVIDRNPDNPVISELLDWPYCAFDRHYTSENLNHDVFTLYY